MKCFRCDAEMVKDHEGGVVIDTCPACRGTWLDGGELDQLKTGESKDLSVVLEELRAESADEETWQLTVIGFCPSCQASSLYEITEAGVELDFCPNCKGMFFDHGELDTVMSARKKSLFTVLKDALAARRQGK